MELRNPNKSHYPTVLALLERCFQPVWSPQALADRIYYEPHYDPSHVWMAREEGKVLGFLVTTLDGDKAYIKLLAVDPDGRRKGLASDMVSRAEYRLSGEGATQIFVTGTPPFEFLPGVLPDSAADLFFKSQGYQVTPSETHWLPVADAPATSPGALDKAATIAFAQKVTGPAWPWVEETLGTQPPRMAYLPGDGLILAEPGQSIGPLWLDPAAATPTESAQRLVAAGRAIAQSLPVADERGLRFWKLPGSELPPRSAHGRTQGYHHFSKTLA